MTIADPRSSTKLDWTLKGTLPRWEGQSVDAALAEPLSLFDDQLPLPIALLKREVVRENSAWMRRFLAAVGVQFSLFATADTNARNESLDEPPYDARRRRSK